MESVVLRELSIGYRDTKVGSEINASLYSGEFTCLLGSNGVGKSTLLKTISGFIKPLAGDVVVDDVNINDYSAAKLARKISVVLTGKPGVENISVGELVGMGRYPFTGFWGTLNKDDEKIVDESLDMVGVLKLKTRMVQTLSDGERQKTMIAKALAQHTQMIFLDEPTAFLDFPSKIEMMQMLQNLSHHLGKTILLSTHDVEQALQLADKLWLMNDDRMCIGTPRELSANDTLGSYIERDNIEFDKKNMIVKIKS